MAILRIPTLIDPHIHPIENNLQSWRDLANQAKVAGYGAIQLMPDIEPPLIDKVSQNHYYQRTKKLSIPTYLAAAGTAENCQDLKQLRRISAVKVWLGTGPEELIVYKDEDLRQIMLSTDRVVMVHAEDETTQLRNYEINGDDPSPESHQTIFDRRSALRATVKAITAAKETGRRVYLCHISTGDELELIRQAKAKGIRVFAEAAPHHLFLTENDLERLLSLGKVNPPLRTPEDQKALWEALVDGTIDTIGSDTHLWSERDKRPEDPDGPPGLPNLKLTLPLMMSAVKQGKITFVRAIQLLSTNPARIFSIEKPSGNLFIDMDNPRPSAASSLGWQPYDIERLIGWPVRTYHDQLRT